ncbi:macrophage mannose receptor 1-like isoform X2 [Mercenaria mercenaria]|uniref:macrophage mannose receptor 1-like isoform X2 n=1 Tax=Mercenaria mercenaria TaxID=6596 RepID=UPI00234F19F1|nr:macrophage mannose receptor 1-like isoform X2 [Mercenaria mercenaria]
MICQLVIYLALFVGQLRAEYDCLCNYNVEKGVYPTASDKSKPMAYLYEFDCKPVVRLTPTTSDWAEIAIEHKIGYVLKDPQIKVQVCPGEVSSEDKLTTVSVPVGQTSLTTLAETTSYIVETSQTTSTVPTTRTSISTNINVFSTTPVPTTSTTNPTTSATQVSSSLPTSTASTSNVPTSQTPDIVTTLFTTAQLSQTPGLTTGSTLVCPTVVQQSAPQETGTLFINYDDRKCYEMITTRHTWEYAEKDCKLKGGHLATIGDSRDEDLVYKYIKSYGHATWIGLHDMNTEESFEWASGEPVVYLNWHAGRKNLFLHGIEDCVAMGPLTGTWEDMDCLDRYAYICEYDAVYGSNDTSVQVSTPSQTGTYTTGNTMMCPSPVRSAALNDNAELGQYGRSCYELISRTRVSWEHGENMCRNRGGHLAHINNADEQGFVQYFMNRYSPQHAIWIGLHDTKVEGQFEWSSGNTVSFTNWVPGHKSNFQSSHTEDCVAFIPYKNGQWDDIPCGNNLILFGDLGETHPILCQYETMGGDFAIIVFTIVCTFFRPTLGDYSCICNYNVEKAIFSSKSEQGQPIGYMYEFDCKAQQGTEDGDWLRIAFEHQVGYIRKDGQIMVQVCAGSPPDEDIGTVLSCHDLLSDTVTKDNGTLFAFGEKCLELLRIHTTWVNAELECRRKGGHLISIADSNEQRVIYQVINTYYHEAVWIGLHDMHHEEKFEWTSGKSVVYTNWYPGRKDPTLHWTEDCVAMALDKYSGRWEDRSCKETRGFICQFEKHKVSPPSFIG